MKHNHTYMKHLTTLANQFFNARRKTSYRIKSHNRQVQNCCLKNWWKKSRLLLLKQKLKMISWQLRTVKFAFGERNAKTDYKITIWKEKYKKSIFQHEEN